MLAPGVNCVPFQEALLLMKEVRYMRPTRCSSVPEGISRLDNTLWVSRAIFSLAASVKLQKPEALPPVVPSVGNFEVKLLLMPSVL